MDRDWNEPQSAYVVDLGLTGRARTRPPSEVLESKYLTERGYHLVDPDSVRLALLTAIWPPEQRVWIYDRRSRVERWWRDDGSAQNRPLSEEHRREIEGDINSVLARAGLAPRPAGRLWFVRLPTGRRNLARYQMALAKRVERSGISDREPGPQWAECTKLLILQDFESMHP